ncbi:T9SS type A sorting domain-containing protein [bacterium]|nr:T9SS type A sorting domain-containing protein [bacterium]
MNRLAKHAVLLLLALLFLIPANSSADILGDTLHIGQTWLDHPQPFSNPQSLMFYPGDQHADDIFDLLWFRQQDASSNPEAMLHRIEIDWYDEEWYHNPDYLSLNSNSPVLGGRLIGRAGFAQSLLMLVSDYEGDESGFMTWIGRESVFVPGFYDLFPFPNETLGDRDLGEPQGVMGADGFLHTVQTTFSDDSLETQQTWYLRWADDTINDIILPETPHLISEDTRIPSSSVAVSQDGDHVAIAMLRARDEETGERTGLLRSNNDLYLYESWDSGVTWNWDNPTNITNWIEPDDMLLPDSTTANQDTLRCVRDATVYIDEDDNVHVFFTVAPMDYYRETVSGAGMIYHWDNHSETYVLVADGSQLEGRPDETGCSVDSPAFQYVDDTGIGYLVFRRVSTEEAPADTANGFASTDLYLTVGFSPEDRTLLHWSQPIRLTQTNWTTPDVPMNPGQAQSESHHSLCFRSSDYNLYLSYLVDRWPGIGSDSTGAMNDIVLQWSNLAVIHEALTNQWGTGSWEWPGVELVQNYPLHIDSTGYYEWEWEADVPPCMAQPVEFVLHPASPNPFNPSTRISFALGSRQTVRLTVYDVLGREVAVLLDRAMMAGEHTVAFSGADLPSGMYFCKLQVADQVRMQKMVLMK